MGGIFISYRRGVTEGQARALFNDLVTSLGKGSVFMDVNSIALGRDFRKVLQERLESCDLMLALIGPDWVDAKDPSGKRRLESPADFVRLEIGTALKRNIPITPVLVQGAQMPSGEQLPEDIRDFAYRNGFELSHNRWESDVQEMIRRLDLGEQTDTRAVTSIDPPAQNAATPHSSIKKSWLAGAGAAAIALAIGGSGWVYYQRAVETRIATEKASAEVTGAKTKANTDAVANTKAKSDADAARTVPGSGPRLYQVTGPVLDLKDDVITVEKGKEKWEIGRDKDTKVNGQLRLGVRSLFLTFFGI